MVGEVEQDQTLQMREVSKGCARIRVRDSTRMLKSAFPSSALLPTVLATHCKHILEPERASKSELLSGVFTFERRIDDGSGVDL